MITEQFLPLDIECLIKTAVELWEQIDVGDLSERQQQVLNRARHAMYAEYAGEEPGAPMTTAIPGPSPQRAWVLRRWERHSDEVTLWADEDSALRALSEHARSSWDSIADRDDVPNQPPTDNRQAVDLYYSPEQERGEEGYTLYTDEIRTSAPPGGTSLVTAHGYQFPNTEDCERANRAAAFHPMRDEDTLPCIEVAGIQVYTYLDPTTRTVRVSIHLDTTDAALLRPDETVPLRVMCGDEVLFDDDRPLRGTAAANYGRHRLTPE
ncbi:hypothetical protein [Actinomadura spongiicola]|nr:hypothetical protein [Actinomadura spongiicola]